MGASCPRSSAAQVIDDHRLAYVAEAPVNWCPGLGTVLANEEVTPDGRSERGNFPVFKRNLKQWMMRITAYGDRLVDDLDTLDWPEPVKLMQRNWIGRSTRRARRLPDRTAATPIIAVFTTRPDTLFGATYMVLAPEHALVDALIAGGLAGRHQATPGPAGTHPGGGGRGLPGARPRRKTEEERHADAKDKTGVFTGAYATNPVNGARIPVFIADYVLAGYGTGAIMAVPGQDERDWEFAEVFDLPIVRTVAAARRLRRQAFTGDGPAINSATLAGRPGRRRRQGRDDRLAGGSTAHGTGATTYRLRDWLFSRQRYWGEPFPIVYDETGLPVALPESMLPVVLPEVDDFSPRTFDPDDADSEPGDAAVAREATGSRSSWTWATGRSATPARPTRCRSGPARAGTSCATWTRTTTRRSSTRRTRPTGWARSADGDCGGVDLYVGGVEHAVLHLLYARFWHKVLFDLGHVSSFEPFRKLFNQGYIQAYAFRDARGMIVPAEEVVERDGKWFLRRRRRSTASTARWASR